jgi:DNA-directed RNA polymerase subunit F
MDVIKEETVSIPEAKEIMDERGEDKNLAYEQKICIEYFDKIPHITRAKAEKMKEELSEIKSLKPAHVISIINIMPEIADEVHMLLGKESLKKDEVEKILEIVKKYKSKKV